MKTIIFISNFMGNGGAARVIAVLAKGMVEQGHRVIVASFPFDGYSYPIDESIEKITLSIESGLKGIKRKTQRIGVIRELLMKHCGATIIAFEYFVNIETIFAARGLGCNVIVSERNDPAQEDKKKGIKLLRNFVYQFADTLVCQTPDAKAYFPMNIQKNTVIIPNPITFNLPEPYQRQREKKIVNFCRLEQQKNLTMLVDAFEIFLTDHQDYLLYIYGNGSEKDTLINYIAQKNLTSYIVVHEAIPKIHDEVIGYAMFVSSSDYEGLSNSMLEAMAIGLPTICTDCPCGGASMVITNRENGILTPVGNAQALADAMIEVADDECLREKISKNAVLIREVLSVSRIIKQWMEIT